MSYKTNLEGVDWQEMKAALAADKFDNGRSSEQLRASFAQSYATAIAYIDGRIVGTARALSDGVCNAYVVDVWTMSDYRKQGIASQMMHCLLDRLPGQHVYLFTDDAVEFYASLGFRQQAIGMGRIVGHWLESGA